jgi:hypothetical protein
MKKEIIEFIFENLFSVNVKSRAYSALALNTLQISFKNDSIGLWKTIFIIEIWI